MSTQNANAVAITGGSLNNVTIGGSTPNTGAFTNVNATTVTATTGSFTNVSGNGAALTAINASNISSGTIDNARTSGSTSNSASTIVLRDANGSFGANIISAAFSGDGSAISAINASNLSSGTVANARTSAATANGASTIVLRDGSGGFGAGAITATSISGNGVALTAINASNIASGTIDNARTSAATANGASTIVLRDSTGSFAAGVITANGSALTAINASSISSGTVATARLATGTANSSTYLRGDSTWAAVSGGTTIPAGTVMLFGQTAAPTGFTKLTNLDNYALRVVSGTASTGGSVAFTTAFASQTPTGSVSITAVAGSAGATTLTTPQIPAHSHVINQYSGDAQPTTRVGFAFPNDLSGTSSTNNTGGGGSHTHPFSFSSGSGTFTGNAINLAVQYVDVIRATKD